MTPSLSTSRLLLKPLELEDARQVQPLFAHWDVVRYLADTVPWPYPLDGAHTYFRDVALPAVERGEEWHWTMRLKSLPEQIIGAVGLFRSSTNNRGFWLGLPWRRQGLMTEAVEAVTDFWFQELAFERLRAPKASSNRGSIRISQRTGMKLESRHRQRFVSGEQEAETWAITREDWWLHKTKRRSGESAAAGEKQLGI